MVLHIKCIMSKTKKLRNLFSMKDRFLLKLILKIASMVVHRKDIEKLNLEIKRKKLSLKDRFHIKLF